MPGTAANLHKAGAGVQPAVNTDSGRLPLPHREGDLLPYADP